MTVLGRPASVLSVSPAIAAPSASVARTAMCVSASPRLLPPPMNSCTTATALCARSSMTSPRCEASHGAVYLTKGQPTWAERTPAPVAMVCTVWEIARGVAALEVQNRARGRDVRKEELPASEGSPRAARVIVADELDRMTCLPEMVDVALLLTTELVTNAVVHADTAAIVLVVDLRRGALLVEVGDDDPTSPAPLDRDVTALSGRGIALVAALASSWGVSPAAPGKTVWF